MRTDTNTKINQILSDQDYKASIIKIIQVITNSLETNTDIQNLSKEIEVI